MKMKNKTGLLRLTIAGILAAGIVNSQSAIASDFQENISVTPARALSHAEERMMARSAARVLRYIADARSAINTKDIDKARSNLEQARNLINILKSQQPTARVHDHIWVARQHLEYDSTEEVIADLVPIEADLTEIEDFVAVEKARKHTRAAHAHLKKGEKAGAKKELQAADVALIYTEVDLPLSATERQIIAAQKALDNNQPAQANKALKQAEEGVQFLSTAVAMPITQARNSFWQVTRDYAARNYAAASTGIDEANVWLDRAAQSTDRITREEAVKLKHWLENLKGKIEQADEGVEPALIGIWQRSKALAERETEKASAAWDKMSSESETKTHLIEAKLHLAYAETAQFVQGKSVEVSHELEQAQSDLKNAARTSDKALSAKIHAMSEELKQLKNNLDDRGASARSHYENVKADLRQTIHDL